MKQITAYRCDFCGKVVMTKQYMKKHEKECFNNPERRACKTCAYPYYLKDNIDAVPKRKCEKGVNLTYGLEAECIYYKSAIEAGVSGWYTKIKEDGEVKDET